MRMKKVFYRFSTIVLLGCVSIYFEDNLILSRSLSREQSKMLLGTFGKGDSKK